MDVPTILTLNKSQYLSTYPSPTGKAYDKLVVGAIIFHPSTEGPERLLLLKRAPHEKVYPNVFENSGGHVEGTDATIFDALRRKVQEEASLWVQSVRGAAEPFSYTTEKIVEKGDEKVLVKKTTLQQSFVCVIEQTDFRLNSEEHSEGVWARRDDVGGLDMTGEMRVVVENAFEWVEGDDKDKVQ